MRDTFIIISRSQNGQLAAEGQGATTYAMASGILLLSVFLYGTSVPNLSLICLILSFPAIFFLRRKTVTVSFLLDASLVFLFAFLYYTMSVLFEITTDDEWLESKFAFLIANMTIAYIIGYFLAQNFAKISAVIAVTAGGLFSYGFLSTAKFTLEHFGEVAGNNYLIAERAVPSFWNGGIVNGPIVGIFFSLSICLIAMVYSRINLLLKGCFVALALVSVFLNLMLQNRSPIYAGVLSISIATLLYLTQMKLTHKKLITLLVLICLLPLNLFFVDFSETKSLLDNPFMERLISEGLDTPRYQLWYKGVLGLIEYPMGGAKTDFAPYDYAHNLWLDVGWYVGWIPMLLLLLIQVRHLPCLFRFVRSYPDQSYGVIGLSVSFLVAMMVEPTLIASYTYVTLFFFFIGYLKGLSGK
ncbi:hypothetical protein [Brevibacillus brevis]|uniref:O-antigen ligase family protein n=1 Tax=Brevibacillus brevis TaxID=1393 RepID=A0ABY9SZR3_BREBE|nr:hypothetical protein [Brevibacillus brevis]WNC13335.1 hypothetical protein RGB73_21925 [Brevibacillus brevis]